MYSFLSVDRDVLYCVGGRTLTLVTNGGNCEEDVRVSTHDEDFVFLSEGFATDRRKRLYSVCDGRITFLTKLSKPACSIVRMEHQVFVLDKFGDVYSVDLVKGTKSFVLGNLCCTTSMCVGKRDEIITTDVYGRVRVSRPDGTICRYAFMCHPIISSALDEDGLVIAHFDNVLSLNDKFDITKRVTINGSIRKLIRGDETIVLSDVLRNARNEILVDEYVNDAIPFGSGVAFISETDELVVGKIKLKMGLNYRKAIEDAFGILERYRKPDKGSPNGSI